MFVGGGSTSVDITTRGIDKAFGMGKLVEETAFPPEMLFIGDRLIRSGNILSCCWLRDARCPDGGIAWTSSTRSWHP